MLGDGKGRVVISKTGKEGDYEFSDGSLLEGGNVGGGAFVVKEGGAEEEVECGIGDVATVWDGEVASMAEGLARTGEKNLDLSRLEGSYRGC